MFFNLENCDFVYEAQRFNFSSGHEKSLNELKDKVEIV